jgi:hypothetical protein
LEGLEVVNAKINREENGLTNYKKKSSKAEDFLCFRHHAHTGETAEDRGHFK